MDSADQIAIWRAELFQFLSLNNPRLLSRIQSFEGLLTAPIYLSPPEDYIRLSYDMRYNSYLILRHATIQIRNSSASRSELNELGIKYLYTFGYTLLGYSPEPYDYNQKVDSSVYHPLRSHFFDTNPVDHQCCLCFRVRKLANSHIIPKNLLMLFKETNSRFHFNGKWVQPNGVTLKLLCGSSSDSCETRFSLWENHFCTFIKKTREQVLLALRSDIFEIDIEYSPAIFFCIISIIYRLCFFQNFDEQTTVFFNAMDRMRSVLLDPALADGSGINIYFDVEPNILMLPPSDSLSLRHLISIVYEPSGWSFQGFFSILGLHFLLTTKEIPIFPPPIPTPSRILPIRGQFRGHLHNVSAEPRVHPSFLFCAVDRRREAINHLEMSYSKNPAIPPDWVSDSDISWLIELCQGEIIRRLPVSLRSQLGFQCTPPHTLLTETPELTLCSQIADERGTAWLVRCNALGGKFGLIVAEYDAEYEICWIRGWGPVVVKDPLTYSLPLLPWLETDHDRLPISRFEPDSTFLQLFRNIPDSSPALPTSSSN